MWHFVRKKRFNALTSLVYRLQRLLPMSRRVKFLIFSDVAWIANRIANEAAGDIFSREHLPATVQTDAFIDRQIGRDDAVLDLGCADGRIAIHLATRCGSIVGIDHNTALIELAKRNSTAKNAEFICADALDYLTHSNRRFDAMICSHILEHLDDPASFLSSFQAHFKRIYVELPDNDSVSTNYVREALGQPPLYMDADHMWEFTRQSAAELIESAGFRVADADHSFGVMRFWIEPTIDPLPLKSLQST